MVGSIVGLGDGNSMLFGNLVGLDDGGAVGLAVVGSIVGERDG